MTVNNRPSLWTALFFVIAAGLFFIANRASYKGYFMDDDLNALSWATKGDVSVFLHWLVLPRFHPENFRPVGAFYYRILGSVFGLDYPPYVAVLHLIHFCNVIILYLVLRRLKLPPVASGAGALFFMFHVAMLDIYWKPMFVYDLLCGSFSLLTLLLYVRGNWILGLITFWLAYKAKEVAVMLPLALAAFELLEGRRNWKLLIPYFAISLNFGLQGIFLNPNQNNAYALHFGFDTIWKGLTYYTAELFFVPYALLLAALLTKDRRMYFGLLTALILLFPMLVLPGRQFPAYWYVPLIGVAIAAASLASRTPLWVLAGFFILWFGLNYAALRGKRSPILAAADANRAYVAALADFARKNPEIQAVGYDGNPPEMHEWGIEGAVHILFGNGVRLYPATSSDFKEAGAKLPSALIRWEPNGKVTVQRAF